MSPELLAAIFYPKDANCGLLAFPMKNTRSADLPSENDSIAPIPNLLISKHFDIQTDLYPAVMLF